MSSWIDPRARRMLLAGALAFAVGAPTLACMGGDTTPAEDDAAEEGAGEADEADEADDAAAKAIGNWQVQPKPEDLRMMKIINMALNPKMDLNKFKQKLKPPPSAEEQALFKDVKKLPPDSPEAEFFKMQVQMMKGSNLEITKDKWTLTMGGESESWGYTVESSDDTTLVVKLDSGETNTLTFKSDDKISVKITDPGGELELQFVRK